MQNADPRRILDDAAMTWAQVLVVAITVLLNALDGFDVLSISFASPGIAREWGIDRAALGYVLSMELVGMSLGSMLIGSSADRIGRRRTLLACLVVMTVGMAMVTTSNSVQLLSLWRIVTGLGIGGMLAATNAVAAEFSNARHRSVAISVMVIGYPLGAVAGGTVAAHLLKHESWRSVFAFGAGVSALLIPAIIWGVPESVVWLCEKRPARALERVNRSMQRLGHSVIAALPARPPAAPSPPIVDLFVAARWRRTVLVTAVYFFHIATFYFILKWVPKIVVDMGFAPASAAGVLVWANVGGAAGGIVLGMLTARFGLRPPAILFLIASTVMVSVFGHGQASLVQLSVVCAITGFFTNGGVVACYALMARLFPAELRAGGTGFAIGVGRGGAALAPIIAGHLFQAGFGLQFIAFAMSAGSLVAAACIGLMNLLVLGERPAAREGLEAARG
jgi:benzoate transport